MHGSGRDGAGEARGVGVAEVTEQAEGDDGEEDSGVAEAIGEYGVAFGVGAEGERDDQGSGARGDGEGKGVEGLRLERLGGVVVGLDLRLFRFLFLRGGCLGIGSEMPKKRRISEPISSMTARKMMLLMAMRRASDLKTAGGASPTSPRKMRADPTGLMIGSSALKARRNVVQRSTGENLLSRSALVRGARS